MKTVETIADIRAALAAPRRAGRAIGLVPTMGAFHAGHLSLMRRARARCDVVVVSLFVNPTQFNDPADLTGYPRDPDRDAALAADIGVDYLFAPVADEVYPPGFATTVSVSGVTEPLEGAHRGRAHFDGVTTVVTKLFNIVGPDVAFFGQKDAQQALVIRRLVRDLDMPVRIEVCPTVRESDGLALSSRNAHLSPADRTRATALSRALRAVADAVSAGERDPAAARARAVAELQAARVDPDYVELVSAETLAPVTRIDGEVLALIAARVGSTRLIDNQLIRTPAHQDNGRP
ncbi:MAG TPA: pantoate--beta-alanine ligase [Solirubrobacteraceae bacterium]|nr:pantoate--beta-alanine ligase [Solirubrobacteraceae bacterium]